MDPISQGIVGALWAASLAPKHKLKPTLIAGALAGVAALLTLIWRFIDFYLGLLVGGAAFILVMRDIGKSPRQAGEERDAGLAEAAEEEGAASEVF